MATPFDSAFDDGTIVRRNRIADVLTNVVRAADSNVPEDVVLDLASLMIRAGLDVYDRASQTLVGAGHQPVITKDQDVDAESVEPEDSPLDPDQIHGSLVHRIQVSRYLEPLSGADLTEIVQSHDDVPGTIWVRPFGTPNVYGEQMIRSIAITVDNHE